jgi:hypothetical protein
MGNLSKAFSGEVGTGSPQKIRQAENPDHALFNVIGTWSGAADSLVFHNCTPAISAIALRINDKASRGPEDR